MFPFSRGFLKNSQKLIKTIKNYEFSFNVINFSTHKLPFVKDTLIRDTLIFLFSNKFDTSTYLDNNQHNFVQYLINVGLLSSIDNFHYIITHLPFHTKLMDMVCDYLCQDESTVPDIFKKYVIGSFMSPIIQSWIYKNCKYVNKYNIMTSQGQNMTIQLLCENSRNDETYQTIIYINMMMRSLHNVTDKQPLHIVYIATPFQKKLSIFRKNQVLDRILKQYHGNIGERYNYNVFNNPISTITVNSGVSVSNGRRYITIWRKEEYEKVLIHELIHIYNLEKGQQFSPISVNTSNVYPHHTKELFTELQTWYLYIMYRLSQKQYGCTIEDMLNYERIHSILNVHKIFKHYKINDISKFLVVKNNENYMINTQSSVIYYYIFKTFILSEIDPRIEQLLFPPCDGVNGVNGVNGVVMTNYISNKLVLFDGSDFIKPFSISDDTLKMMGI